jgi:Flagellar basal body rod protein
MDALIYTLMSGAERGLRAQQIHANNLANLETGGFRADLELATSRAVDTGYGYDARHMSQLQANAVASREGVMRETGNDLDVAISGRGTLPCSSVQARRTRAPATSWSIRTDS